MFGKQRGSVEHKPDQSSAQAAGPRAKTSQKSRERPSKMTNKGATDRQAAREQGFDTAPDESAFRSSGYKSTGSKWNRPIATEVPAGPKPYELWKQNLVVQPESVVLGQNRDMKLTYD